MMKLGSLFDGSGTCPLAATMCGIEPVWASEIEDYPIRVTKKNFPDMKHVGSVTELNGADLEPVDIICGGSPCQDLSVAGRQKGLIEGERSNLFFEMVRVISEMREATNGQYPRFVLWENVPGAFSSNSGNDFLAVLQHFAEVADPFVLVPEPERKGGKLKWSYSGLIEGDTWSIGWRTMDAQFWGVPQRRRRIFLVMDLGRVPGARPGDAPVRNLRGDRAGQILFEREGVFGYPPKGFRTREGSAGNPESCSGATGSTGDG